MRKWKLTESEWKSLADEARRAQRSVHRRERLLAQPSTPDDAAKEKL
jgi:hypothetical protein